MEEDSQLRMDREEDSEPRSVTTQRPSQSAHKERQDLKEAVIVSGGSRGSSFGSDELPFW